MDCKTVRLQITHDCELVATKSGLKLGNNTITWGWLDKARADVAASGGLRLNDVKSVKKQAKKVSAS